MAPRRVVIVGYDDVELLDVACPADVFDAANHAAPRPRYAVALVVPRGTAVRASCGIRLQADRALDEECGPVDTLVVAGGLGSWAAAADPTTVSAVRRLAQDARRVVGVCTGVQVLAAAGLLDGRRATTHWGFAQDLADRYPAIRVDPAPIFVQDGNVFTSGGVTSALDLSLALVQDDHGPDLARAIARSLVTYLQRPGNQSQVSMFVGPPAAGNRVVRQATDLVALDLAQDLSTAALAGRVGVSGRHLSRLFAADLGMTPARFVRLARIEAASQLLTGTDLPVAGVAARCGFGSAESMRQAFHTHFGLGPGAYRTALRSAR